MRPREAVQESRKGTGEGVCTPPPVLGPLTGLDAHPKIWGWGTFGRFGRAKNGPKMAFVF